MKRCSTQHEATNLVWATRGKAHRDAATERMPEHDYLRCHLLEHRGHCFGVVAGSPSSVGCSRTPKPGQIECDRVDVRVGEHSLEVPVVAPPSMQSKDPRRPGTVRLPE